MAKRDDEAERRRKLRDATRRDGSAPLPGERPIAPPAPGWQSSTVPLPAHHKWKCSPGHNLLIADRGAVRFEYPTGWHVRPGKEGQLQVHDVPPPDDECRIQLSIIRTPGVRARDLADLPLVELLRRSLEDGPKEKHSPGWTRLSDVSTIERPGLQIAWAESSWLDREHGDRKVLCRQLVARGPGMHPFVTFDYYEERAEQFRPVWLHMVQTFKVATPVNLLGDVLN